MPHDRLLLQHSFIYIFNKFLGILNDYRFGYLNELQNIWIGAKIEDLLIIFHRHFAKEAIDPC